MAVTDPLEEIERTTRKLDEYMRRHNRTVFGRYPLAFSLLGTFGVVTTLYGFEQILDEVPLLREHPLIPLFIGIGILLVCGSLYKRLEKKFD
ncbi:MAG: hypothetical protein WDN10_03060 [bacterium]